MSNKLTDAGSDPAMSLDPIDSMKLVAGSFPSIFEQARSKDFAIITAFRVSNPKATNRERNREMLATLRPHGIGGTAMKGAWAETQADGTKKEVSEESFLLTRPDKMDVEAFRKAVYGAVVKYEQDAAVIGIGGDVSLLFQDGSTKHIGTAAKVKSGDIEGAFSKVRGHKFVFEGHYTPGSWVNAVHAQSIGLK